MKKAGYLYLLSSLTLGVIFCFFVELYPLVDLRLWNSFETSTLFYITSKPFIGVALLLILMQMVIGVFLIFRSSKVEDGKKE